MYGRPVMMMVGPSSSKHTTPPTLLPPAFSTHTHTHTHIDNQVLVDQERLHRIARGGVVRLGVHHDAARLLDIRRLVHIDVADALRVAQNGDARAGLDRLDQAGGAPRDDEVDHVVQLEERRDLPPRRDEADGLLFVGSGGGGGGILFVCLFVCCLFVCMCLVGSVGLVGVCVFYG
jgi:hypothetical protein